MTSLEQFMKFAYTMDPQAGNDNKKMMELFDQFKSKQSEKLDESQEDKRKNPIDAMTAKNYGSSNFDNASSKDNGMGSQMDFSENMNDVAARNMKKVNLQFNNSEQNFGGNNTEGNLIIGADIDTQSA